MRKTQGHFPQLGKEESVEGGRPVPPSTTLPSSERGDEVRALTC